MSITHALRRAVAMTALVAASAGAQARTPEAILERYTKLVDPTGLLARLEGYQSSATMEMPAAGMNATIHSAQRRPNQMVVTIDIAGMGQMKQGFDGTTAWMINPMMGPRILPAEESKELQDGADFRAMGRSPDLFKAVEAADEVTVDGDVADCVRITWKSDRVTTECFSRASGLMTQSRATQSSPQGELEVVVRYHDYRTVAGLTIPHRIEQSLMGMQQTIKLTEVKPGPVDAKLFELPAEIQALKKQP